ncbi:hypothetical protein [Micromonospora foliorum]|uniref:hypothetical protein n=1 Tax=Micromonospora foliorum TaxID=2911210 RepID=UPI001EE95AE9|nr:hypothetical protein [Micromonospora foliorum]MCG5438227.1 hypothetical protein [Micromonospora foliorum]
MTPAQRAVVVMVSVVVALIVVSGAVWLLAGSDRPTGGAIATAGWVLVALLAGFGAVAFYLGRRRRR